MKENFSEIPICLKNGYILIQDIKNETTSSGIIIPDETYNRFARVLKTYEGSILKSGDIIIKPIGRTTPVKINDITYDCIKEGFVFAKVIND
jgi:co-chaperonin GroES (HSP10)